MHSSKYGMMQIDSLTKMGEVSCAEELTCITGMFSVVQSVFIRNTFATYMWHGKILIEILQNYSTSTVLHKKATYRNAMHVLKLPLQQNSIKDFMVQNSENIN